MSEHLDITMSEQVDALFTALAAFQGEVTPPKKTASNPHFKSKFADLADVLEAVRAPLAKHGLALTQIPVGSCDGHVRVVTLVTHKSGQWLKGTLDMPLAQKTPQGVGSAISYARRYCAMAALGIAAEDDDGESAEGRGGKTQAAKDERPLGPVQAKPTQQARAVDVPAVLATLNAELPKMGDRESLIKFHNHAWRELDRANIVGEPRSEFWSAWGARCTALMLEPRKVAADATRRAQAEGAAA